MMERLKALALILERMNALYERAIQVLDREKDALIVLDYETLYAFFREKDEILCAIRGLDKDRLKIQDQMATVMDLSTSEATLKNIALLLIDQGAGSEVMGQRLLILRDKLSQTIELLKEKIGLSKDFLERSVENLQGIAETFTAVITGQAGAGARKTDVYTGKATYQNRKATTGSLLEKRF